MGNRYLALNGADGDGVCGVRREDLSGGMLRELGSFLARDTPQLCSHLLRPVEPVDLGSGLIVGGVSRETSQPTYELCLGATQNDMVSNCVPLSS